MYKKFLHSTQRGFTLNELLVVIAIIGILSGIVIASLNPARNTAKNARISSDIGQYLLGLRLHKERFNSYPKPNNNNTLWYCLGSGNPDGKCAGWSSGSSTFEENEVINNALRQTMSTLPAGRDHVGPYQGYVYRCNAYSNNNCTSFEIRWFLYNTDTACDPGVVESPNYNNGGITYCKYTR